MRVGAVGNRVLCGFPVPVGAFCASTGTAASMRGCILRRRWNKAIAVEDRKLVHGLAPRRRGTLPGRRDVAERQPDQFGGRVVVRKVAACLDDFAKLRVNTLERVRRVDDASNLWWKGEERNHA